LGILYFIFCAAAAGTGADPHRHTPAAEGLQVLKGEKEKIKA
jgi:hypothetical protein